MRHSQPHDPLSANDYSRNRGFLIARREGPTILALAYAGRSEDARAALEKASRDQSEDEMDPANELADYLEAAVIIRDRKLAAAFAGLLGDLTAVHRQISVSNVARPLGEAAALTGDLATARRHYDRSLTWATQIRHRPEIALTRLALAELLLEGSSDERAEAKSHLDFAIEEFRAMKMQPSLERALRHKGLLHA